METIKEFLSPKTFNELSFTVVIGSVIFGIILLGVVADTETREQSSFICRIKGEEKEFLQRVCFADYQVKTTRGFPLYGFVLLDSLLVMMVCFSYSQSVKSKVKHLERQDPEMQTNQSSRGLYRRYCIQIAIRLTLGMTFLILQWRVFYPFSFPSEFTCDLSNVKHQNINSSAALYDCYNSQARKKTICAISFFVANVLLTVLLLLELVYVTTRPHVYGNFRTDRDFFNIYLLNKDNEVLKKYVEHMEKMITKQTNVYETFVQNDEEGKRLLELDNIYTNLNIYPGQVSHEFTGNQRTDRLEKYQKPPKRHQPLNDIEDIFVPNAGDEQETSLAIMIIGRPGIGKSSLCRKILRDWACGKIFHKETEARKRFQFVYLFQFKQFNSDEKKNLQQLLGTCPYSGALPNEVYDWILNHPEKVLLIFDGLDEFAKKENFLKEEEFENNIVEPIPFSALYSKLTLGKLLNGATVLTTSRATALSSVLFPNKAFDHTLEALGFDLEQIKKYVEKFCQDNDLQHKLWTHISSNANLLSLCYIPVNCHIVCSFLLDKLIKPDETNGVDDLPTTLTEIYEEALKLIVCKHSPQYRYNITQQEELLERRVFAPEVETSLKSLGEVAYQGIEENRLSFESKEVQGHEEIGLLHRLPDKKHYCFLHLTIQELLAARYLVTQIMGRHMKVKLHGWIMEHLHEPGKWEVVIQFVAGLLHHHKDQDSIIAIFIGRLPRSSPARQPWPAIPQEKEVVITLLKCIFEISRNSKDKWKNMITELSGIVNVDLSRASLTAADLTPIVFVMQEMKNIESLNVSWNSITPIGCLEIYKQLTNKQHHSTNIGSLKVYKPWVCKLTTLDISHNNIGDDGLKHLSGALATNECKLTTLDISFNGIGDDGLKHLSGALATNECKLTTLNSSSNEIGDDGLKHLSGALATNECKLTTLDISFNGIGDDGFKHLFVALATNECKLTKLDISNIKISDDGLEYLGEALTSKKCKLTTLKFENEIIGEDELKECRAC